jgi:hypothetical protein
MGFRFTEDTGRHDKSLDLSYIRGGHSNGRDGVVCHGRLLYNFATAIPVDELGTLKGRTHWRMSGGEFVYGRVVVLLAADFAVVFGRGFE